MADEGVCGERQAAAAAGERGGVGGRTLDVVDLDVAVDPDDAAVGLELVQAVFDAGLDVLV